MLPAHRPDPLLPEALPQAAQPFVVFPTLLRANGFRVSPDQTMAFVESIGLLRPSSLHGVLRAARATLAPPPERFAEFDALFRMFFAGQSLAAPATTEAPDDEMQVFDEDSGQGDVPEPQTESPVGEQASRGELLTGRAFGDIGDSALLRRFRREAGTALPSRLSYRRAASHRGDRYDMRRNLRELVSRDGETLRLYRWARKRRQRRILLLIDVSGSMKANTVNAFRLAHALGQAADHFECFTLGTRLTRISPALRLRDEARALNRAASLVADFDGGTRIGEALGALLAIPRHADFARGALVVVVSDGLERGDPRALVQAMARLSKRAWQVLWLSPLAGDPRYEPRTEAMLAIRPMLSRLDDGSSIASLCSSLLTLAKEFR
ncbi:MAG: VWA domain-containing protein [Burkholderiaceae bacterium]